MSDAAAINPVAPPAAPELPRCIQLAWLLIATWEGFRAAPYLDQAGIPTIGYGRTGSDVSMATAPTTPEAEEAWAKGRLQWLWQRIDRDVHRDLNANQAAAVISLAYNCGLGTVQRGTFWHYLQDGQWEPAANALLSFDKVRKPGGVLTVDPGLIKRRKAERTLFLSDPA